MLLLRSKITPPGLPRGTIDRPRLLERILERDRPLVLLQAPAGYGKSILAAQVHARDPRRTAWLYLEPEDAELRRFCNYLVGSLAEVVPAVRKTELPGSVAAPDFDPGVWVEDLALFLQEVNRRRLRLILDNFESVATSREVVGLVDDMLRRSRDYLSVLVTSRTPPGFRLRRRVAGDAALVLGSHELAFSLEEFRRAVGAVRDRGDAADVEARWARSAGWCVAVMLGQGRSDREEGDYLEEEILDDLPGDLASRFESISLLPEIDAPGLAALGHDDLRIEDLARDLTDSGVPHFLVEDSGTVRLHPLVRERLLERYRRAHPEPKPGDPADRVIRWLDAGERLGEVIRMRFDLADYQGVLETISTRWSDLEAQDLLPQLQSWLSRFPPSHQDHPLFMAARIQSLRFNGENRELIGEVERLRKAGSLDPANRLAIEIWASEVWARTHLALGPGYDRLRERWTEIEGGASLNALLRAQYSLAVAALYELRFSESRVHVEEVQRLSRGSLSREATAANAAAVVLHEIGKSQEALALFDEQIALCRSRDEMTALPVNLVGKANVCKDVGRFHDAVALADEALQVGGAARLVVLPHAARIRGEALWHLGRPGAALAELSRAFAYFQNHNRYEALATGVLIDHWSRLTGKPTSLVTSEDFRETPACEARVRFLIRQARQQAEEGAVEEALASLVRAREMAREMPFWLAATRFNEGWVRSRSASGDAGDEALRMGLDDLEALDRTVYGMADPELNAWIAAGAVALDHRVERALAMVTGDRSVDLTAAFSRRLQHAGAAGRKRLLEAAARLGVRGLGETLAGLSEVSAGDRARYAEAAAGMPLPPVTVRVLGPLEVVVQGRAVQFPRKASRSVLEILVLEHPRSVHEEQLLEFLWPEADPDRAKHSLQTAVNDLRRALDPYHRARSPSYVRYQDETYALHLPAGSFVDLLEFRSGLEELLGKRRDTEPGPPRRRRLAELLDLYRDELLADAAYAEHAGEPRERVRSLMLEGVAALARELAGDAGEEATVILRRGLEADVYWGEGVALLMDQLERQGRSLAAIRLYRDYERRLRADLGLEPESPLTERFRKLTS